MLKRIFFKILFINVLLFCIRAPAEISRLRASGNFGYGNAAVTNYNVGLKTYIESPFGGSGSIEYYLTPFLDIGVEHMRSYGKNQTGVGLSGITFKYYFYNDHPQYLAGVFSGDSVQLAEGAGYYYIKSLSPYLGIGGGFAQATIPSHNVMAFNEYLNFKGGLDYPAGAGWGYRTESNIAVSLAGSGKITVVNWLFGLYFFL